MTQPSRKLLQTASFCTALYGALCFVPGAEWCWHVPAASWPVHYLRSRMGETKHQPGQYSTWNKQRIRVGKTIRLATFDTSCSTPTSQFSPRPVFYFPRGTSQPQHYSQCTMKLNAGGLGTPNSTRMRIKGDAGCRHGQVTLGRLGEPCTSKPSQPSTNQHSGDWKPKAQNPPIQQRYPTPSLATDSDSDTNTKCPS